MLTTEAIFTSSAGFGIETATPLQRAICRILDGLPLGELADNPDVHAALGCSPSLLAPERPAEVDILGAVRTAKTILACAAAICATQRINLDALGHYEIPRVTVISGKIDLADVPFGFVTGALTAGLRPLLLASPTADSVLVRHPSGRAVEIKVAAADKAGAAVTARWSAGVIVDEYGRPIGGSFDFYDELRSAAIARLLPGAQLISIGSPWAPFGQAYDRCAKFFGRPSRNVVFLKGAAKAMNPSYWTDERCERLREQDEDAYNCDVLVNFRSGEGSPFPIEQVDRIFVSDVPPGRWRPAMFWDPNSGGANRFAWCIGGMYYADPRATVKLLDVVDKDGKVVMPKALVATDPSGRPIVEDEFGWLTGRSIFLVRDYGQSAAHFHDAGVSGDSVVDELLAIAKLYGVKDIHSDQRERMMLRSAVEKRGYRWHEYPWSAPSKHEAIGDLIGMMRDRKLLILKTPLLASTFRAQFVQYRQTLSKKTGEPVYQGPTSDLLSTVITAAHAMKEGLLPDAPNYQSNAVTTSGPGWGTAPRRHVRGY